MNVKTVDDLAKVPMERIRDVLQQADGEAEWDLPPGKRSVTGTEEGIRKSRSVSYIRFW